MAFTPTSDPEYNDELQRAISAVFDAHPELHDHRGQFPWLTGCLGDPSAPVWFVAEYPSLTQIERVQPPHPESQWAMSRGDKLFRHMLTEAGFKAGGDLAPGGWNCYITNVVKSAQRAGEWDTMARNQKDRIVNTWAPALDFELRHGAPRVVATLGRNAAGHLDRLQDSGYLPKAFTQRTLDHYTYVATKPRGGIPGNDPRRVAEYLRQFQNLRSLA